MKYLLVFCAASFAVARGDLATAAPGDLVMTIHSPDPLYGGFGHGLAVSGTEIAIGAYARSNHDVVFRYDARLGSQLAMYPSGTSSWSGFGASVAFDGDRIVAGGPFYPPDYSTGRTVVLDTVTAAPVQTTVGTNGSYFGWSTAISTDYYAVGAWGASKVYVYDRGTNAQQYVLSSTGAFGQALAAEGGRLAVGTPRQTVGSTAEAGAVYLYEASSQGLLRTFTSPNPNDVNFGWSVAQRGGQVLIGAPYAEVGGAAYLFDADSGALLQSFHNPTPSAHDRFGWSVAFSGDYAVVGATKDGSGPSPSGSAYAFRMDSGALAAQFNDPAPMANGEFGWAVAGFNGLAVVSGHCNGVGTGDVYFFAIPEPSSLILLGIGAAAVLLRCRRRGQRSLVTAILGRHHGSEGGC